jgi:integrase
MIAQGAQPMTLKALMGHASITTTLDRYGHLFPGHDDEVMDGLDATFNAVPAPDNVVELRGT